jgi:hypothetical protein
VHRVRSGRRRRAGRAGPRPRRLRRASRRTTTSACAGSSVAAVPEPTPAREAVCKRPVKPPARLVVPRADHGLEGADHGAPKDYHGWSVRVISTPALDVSARHACNSTSVVPPRRPVARPSVW